MQRIFTGLTSLIVIILITACPSFSQTVTLNEFGRITTADEPYAGTVSVDPLDNTYRIEYENILFRGNALIPVDNGFLTIDAVSGAIPSVLRLYDMNGYPVWEESFPQTINLTLSSNKRYAAFYDGSNVVVVNLHTLDISSFPGGVIFAIDDTGMPVYTDKSVNKIRYRDYEIDVTEYPVLYKFLGQTPVVFHRTKISILDETGLMTMYRPAETFFDAHIEDGNLYIVDRIGTGDGFIYKLYRMSAYEEPVLVDQAVSGGLRNLPPPGLPTDHEEIRCPINYYEEDAPALIGNSYGNIQQYGPSPYLHPGVDILGDPFQNVYSVQNGVVRAVLTTGGDLYWRVAVENLASDSDAPEELKTGYLYAHLNQNSITVQIGDTVSTGDLLGTLVPWPTSEFHHIHFARIAHTGEIWDGNWWTTNNPHVDIVNIVDTTPPVFENARGDDLFAFRTLDGDYLEPDDLYGKIDIISKSYDLANTNWKIDVWKLRYRIYPVGEPDLPVIDTLAFVFDFPLDTYINSVYDNMVLYTVFSRDDTCFSSGNYTYREYYHILTNSRGTGEITEEDQHQYFDTEEHPDGNYIIEVTAIDAAMNSTTASMEVTFNNLVTFVDGGGEEIPDRFHVAGNYPNPFNPSTTILFSIPEAEYVSIRIYDILGKFVETVLAERLEAGTHRVLWDARDLPSGMYYYRIEAGSEMRTQPAVLIR